MIELRGSVRRPDGTVLAFQLRGPRSAPVLLLLQGQANNHRWWTRLRGDFADTHLTVTFDYRGTGESRVPTEVLADRAAWSTHVFADDAAAVLAAIGKNRADVYGTSMGGRIAQHLAASRPELIEHLVLACTSPGGRLGVERSNTVRQLLAAPPSPQRRRVLFDLFYRPQWTAAHGGYDHAPTDLLGDPQMSSQAKLRHLQVSDAHDAADVLALIQAPTLILHGSDDQMAPPENADLLAEHIPGATRRLIDGGRHGFFDEFHGLLAPVIRAHLT